MTVRGVERAEGGIEGGVESVSECAKREREREGGWIV